jgi:hypothetical protein
LGNLPRRHTSLPSTDVSVFKKNIELKRADAANVRKNPHETKSLVAPLRPQGTFSSCTPLPLPLIEPTVGKIIHQLLILFPECEEETNDEEEKEKKNFHPQHDSQQKRWIDTKNKISFFIRKKK